MPTMEGIIRPFQTTVDPIRVTEFNQVGVPLVRQTVGRGGGGVQFGGSYSLTITFYQDKAINELSQPGVGLSPEMQAWAQRAAAKGGSF